MFQLSSNSYVSAISVEVSNKKHTVEVWPSLYVFLAHIYFSHIIVIRQDSVDSGRSKAMAG